MNLFNYFKHKPEPKPIRHYRPEMTADCKGVLSGPILPDCKIDFRDEGLENYIAKIGEERRN